MTRRAMEWETFETADSAAPPMREAEVEEFKRPEPVYPETPEEAAEKAAEAARRAEEEALAELLARARGEGRAEGFEQGAAQAEQSFIAERRMILSEIRERLADSEVAQARLEAETATALRELAEALTGALAPALARHGLAAEVAAAVAAAHADRLSARGAPKVAVAAPSAQLPAIRAALDEAGLDAELSADDALGGLEARVAWGGGVDAVDLDKCRAAALDAVTAHFDEEEERRAHG